MQPAGFFWQNTELFVLHMALVAGAVVEVALAWVAWPSCFLKIYQSDQQDVCSLGVAVGLIALVSILVLWVGGMWLAAPPRYDLSVSYFVRTCVISAIICLLWLGCSIAMSVALDNTCQTQAGHCAILEGYDLATWMLVACWASTLVWLLLFGHSLWRKYKVGRSAPEKAQEAASASGQGMELATFNSNQKAVAHADVIRSGYLQVRKVPLEGSKAAKTAKTIPMWVKRYVVVTHGVLTTYAGVEKMSAGEEEVTGLLAGAHLLERPPSPQLTEGTWGLVIPGKKERLEFVVLEEPEMEQPNLARDQEEFSGREDPLERRVLWMRAFGVALPSCVFGVPVGLAVARGGGEIPEPIRVAVEWLDEHALDEQGLYRVPGSKSEVDSMIARFDQGLVVSPPELYFGGNLASVVVQYLRRLPSPLFTVQLAPLFERAAEEGNVGMLKLLLGKLPLPHFCTLRAIILHLARVSEYSQVNEMTSSNLAMCVFSSMASTADALIANFEFLFDQLEPTLLCECAAAHHVSCALLSLNAQERPSNSRKSSRASHRGLHAPGSREQDDLLAARAALERANAQLQLEIEEQKRIHLQESQRRARQAAEEEKVESKIRNLLHEMVTTDQQQQQIHEAKVARLQEEIARLQQGRI